MPNRHTLALLAVVPLSLITGCGGDEAPVEPTDAFVALQDTGGPPPPPDVTTPDAAGPRPDVGSTPPPTAVDPCEDVGRYGRCVGNTAEYCVDGSDGGAAYVTRKPCGFGFICTDTFWGPECESTRVCEDGDTRCDGFDVLSTCENGQWSAWACDTLECRRSAFGDHCATAPIFGYTTYSNRITFEARGVNDGWTDWSSTTFSVPAAGVTVASVHGDTIVDVTTTDADGRFSLEAINPEYDPSARIAVLAVRLVEENGRPINTLQSSVMNPGFNRGTVDTDAFMNDPGDVSAWGWNFVQAEHPDDEGIWIGESDGSAALFAAYLLSNIVSGMVGYYGDAERAQTTMWLGHGTDWDCGACFTSVPSDTVSARTQMFLGGGANAGYWSSPVILHELGHWWMWVWGTSPGEGGSHILGIPQHPGLAWSEGFATFFSAGLRKERTYYDKQGGGFFWVDLDARRYSGGSPWYLPEPQYGLMQLMDENEVARMLLELEDIDGADVLDAVHSDRMRDPPFARGYTRRTWSGLDEDGWPWPYADTGVSAPFLADALDALRCEQGVSRAAIDSVTEPSVRYPYPSGAPLCDSARHPFQTRFERHGDALTAIVDRHIPLERDLVIAFEGAPETRTVVPAGTPPGMTRVTTWRKSATPTVAGRHRRNGAAEAEASYLTIDTGGESWGYHARLPVEPTSIVPAPVTERNPTILRLTPTLVSRTIPLTRANAGLAGRPPLRTDLLPERRRASPTHMP